MRCCSILCHWQGLLFFVLFGGICGGITTAIVHFKIGEADIMVWIGGMTLMGIAAFIFYTIRRIPPRYS